MKVYFYPFKKRRMEKNLQKWVQPAAGESIRSYLDTTLFGRKNHGIALTTRRLVQFEKEKILHQCPVTSIKRVTLIDESSEYLPAWKLNLQAGRKKITLEFSGEDDWKPLSQFALALKMATGRDFGISAKGLAPRCRALQEAVLQPLVQTELKKTVPLRRGEQYVAYHSKKFAAGVMEYVITNRRVVEFSDGSVNWEARLASIKGYEFTRVWRDLSLELKDGDKKRVAAGNYLTFAALREVVKEAGSGKKRGEETAVLPKPKSTPAPPLTYPLQLVMVTRGLASGFAGTVTNAVAQTIFQTECRGPILDRMHISSGSRLLATAQVTEAEKSVHFSSPRGAERGRLVRLDKHQFGIIDRRENQIGIIRPAGGLRAWKSRRYELIIDDKPVLEMHCDNQVPWRIYFTIDRVGNVGKEREQLLLRCAFALRLIAPELMKDPVISTLKKARGDLRDNIEELF